MNLSDLPGDPGRKQKRKRVGRGEGSGLGKTSGRGHKGAQSRSGGTGKNLGFEGGQTPFHRRVPKVGFTNRFRTEYAVVNLSKLNAFDDGAEVTLDVIYKQRLASPKGVPVKVLGDGELTKKIKVQANAFSASAKKKIEEAGGSVEVIK